MRKAFIIAIGATAALVAAAVAAAAFTAVGINPTTATLTTETASAKLRTCTGEDGASFAVTSGRYVGKADFSNPATDLDGALTISARTTLDTTAANANHDIGYVEGWFRVRDDDSRMTGRFWGTLDKSNKLTGFLVGTSRGHYAKVVGTLNGTFDPAKGFTSPATVGSAGASGALAVVAGRVCKNPKSTPRPKRLSIKGTLALDGTKVSVTRNDRFTATCIDSASPPLSTGFANGDTVEMKCENTGDGWIVTSLKKVQDNGPKPKRLSIEGKLSIGTGNPVTVSVTRSNRFTATCTVDATSPSLGGFANEDKVEMKCENTGSGWLLRGLKKDR